MIFSTEKHLQVKKTVFKPPKTEKNLRKSTKLRYLLHILFSFITHRLQLLGMPSFSRLR